VDQDSISEDTPASYPYYAIGSHEGGLSGGCCGCVVTETEDLNDKFSIGGGGGCEGTIEFAGGDPCEATYFEATFLVQDACAEYSDVLAVRIDIIEACDNPCSCLIGCDYDEDTFLTALDLGSLIDVLFAGVPEIIEVTCPTSRGDFDCDGFPTALDLGGLIDHLFAGQPGPCEPCLCVPVFPDDCP
jgi:hypothetical protein